MSYGQWNDLLVASFSFADLFLARRLLAHPQVTPAEAEA